MVDCAFISYAREDEDFALQLGYKLKEEAVVPIWLDQWDIPAGADWDEEIDKALHDCDRFLIILSPAAVSSKQVRGELQTAIEENKLIVPLLYKACTVPRVLRLTQYIDFTSKLLEDQNAIDKVLKALENLGPPQLRPPAASQKKFGISRKLIISGVLSVLLFAGSAWYYHSTKESVIVPFTYLGLLEVSVNVDNVRVTVDGVHRGVAAPDTSLLLGDIKPGTRVIRAEAKGYEPQEILVYVVDNQVSYASFLLNPAWK